MTLQANKLVRPKFAQCAAGLILRELGLSCIELRQAFVQKLVVFSILYFRQNRLCQVFLGFIVIIVVVYVGYEEKGKSRNDC